MYVIGTAGHVDHGKSTLVRALTGIDPDRLAEEQRRGMTIELGFAWLTLSNGQELSLVDVPGHERFIKHMLAGVGGFDAVMLVIAADESVMPQTREHLAIIDLLGIQHGIVVVSKADMVDAAWLPLVVDDIRQQLQGSTLATAPLVVVSARHGHGMAELQQALHTVVATLPSPQRRDEPARLWVDRVFSVDGFGAVVTGTLLADTMQVGQEVEIAPRGVRARIRGIQSHRQKRERAEPGSRVALNLAGVSHHDVARGELVVVPGAIVPTQRIDVRLDVARIAPRAVTQGMRLDVFVGAAETSARVTTLASDAIAVGESGFVQLHLDTPLPLWRGDRLIVRQASPSLTVGGGRIIDTHPVRHRRLRPEVIESLTALERATPTDLCWAAVRGRFWHMDELQHHTHLAWPVLQQTLAMMPTVLVLGGQWVIDAQVLDELADKVARAITGYQSRYPLRIGMPREELRRRVALPPALFELLLAHWNAYEACGEGLLRQRGYQVTLTPLQQREMNDIMRQLEQYPFRPPTVTGDRELLMYLVMSGRVVDVGDGVVFATRAWQEVLTWVLTTIDTQGSVSVAQMRDRFDTSRKYALAVMEYLDAQKITRRHDDVRVRFTPQ